MHPSLLSLYIAEPKPPTNLMLAVDGMNVVATWIEPFSLQGEKIFYIIVSITNVASKTKKGGHDRITPIHTLTTTW